MKADAGARGRVFRYYALVPHAYRCTPSRGSAAAWHSWCFVVPRATPNLTFEHLINYTAYGLSGSLAHAYAESVSGPLAKHGFNSIDDGYGILDIK